jgi:phospho-N-acetylmuramoyl-pentapeptide-transferase
MLYFLHLLDDWFSPLRVFQYITVRAVLGAGTAFLLTLALGPPLIALLRRLTRGQHIRKDEAPPLYVLHSGKQGTPTMGGILIVFSLCVATLLWADPRVFLVWIALATVVFMALVGFWDDYLKEIKKQSKGMSARHKLLLQLLWGVAVAVALMLRPETAEKARQLMLPYLKAPAIPDLGLALTVLFVCLVMAGATNAVNLTDGLDGLAIGCSGSAAVAYLVMAYAAGHAAFASYLNVPYVRGAGELAVFCSCLLGCCLGFLWHNCHPARVFMGDTGSLALGGAIAIVAILIKQEISLLIVGGVFVMEALSVIAQVASFRLFGRRVLAMAPIHHHFEMKAWKETQVTVRFWILSILFALMGLMTLKLR